MKKVVSVLFTATLLLLLSGCFKPDHSVRFSNKFSLEMTNVTIGNASIGTVAPGETSAYKSISTGNFNISGQSATGHLEGSGTISGKGKHKWTVTLGADGKITMQEDPKRK